MQKNSRKPPWLPPFPLDACCTAGGDRQWLQPIEFADSSVNYRLLFWACNPLQSFSLGSALRQAIWKRFEEQGITIPFPQRQVYPMQWPLNTRRALA